MFWYSAQISLVQPVAMVIGWSLDASFICQKSKSITDGRKHSFVINMWTSPYWQSSLTHFQPPSPSPLHTLRVVVSELPGPRILFTILLLKLLNYSEYEHYFDTM